MKHNFYRIALDILSGLTYFETFIFFSNFSIPEVVMFKVGKSDVLHFGFGKILFFVLVKTK